MKDLQTILDKVNAVLTQAKKYLPALFVLLLVGVYGFLVYRVNSLTSATPPPNSTVTDQISQVPRISPSLIKQLQSLQDNSTSVQTLFDQARDNPFQE